MENKQTALMWLESKLNSVKPTDFCSIETIRDWINQAKAMEMDQHDLTFARGIMTGYANANGHESVGFKQYFEKTYGTKKNGEESTN